MTAHKQNNDEQKRSSLIDLISTLFVELRSRCIDISIDFFQEGNQTLLELAHHGKEGVNEITLIPQ
jgi:hypothetical protein